MTSATTNRLGAQQCTNSRKASNENITWTMRCTVSGCRRVNSASSSMRWEGEWHVHTYTCTAIAQYNQPQHSHRFQGWPFTLFLTQSPRSAPLTGNKREQTTHTHTHSGAAPVVVRGTVQPAERLYHHTIVFNAIYNWLPRCATRSQCGIDHQHMVFTTGRARAKTARNLHSATAQLTPLNLTPINAM